MLSTTSLSVCVPIETSIVTLQLGSFFYFVALFLRCPTSWVFIWFLNTKLKIPVTQLTWVEALYWFCLCKSRWLIVLLHVYSDLDWVNSSNKYIEQDDGFLCHNIVSKNPPIFPPITSLCFAVFLPLSKDCLC